MPLKVRANQAHNWKNHKVDGTFKKSKRGKYNANGRRIDGHFFPAKAEADRYLQLLELQEQGRISDLELQPAFPLHVQGKLVCIYKADFRYKKIQAGRFPITLIEDVKGMKTKEYVLKRKLMAALLPTVTVHEIFLGKRGNVLHHRYQTADEIGTAQEK